MTNVELNIAVEDNPRTRSLISGDVRADGLNLTFHTELRGPALFRHQLTTREFDISEMSLTSVYMMIDRNDRSFVPVPVFTMRHFFHTTALVREDSGIISPSDLVGHRVGVPNYQSAASLWCRGAFQHEYGVSPFDIKWFTSQVPDADAGEIPFIAPADLDISIIDPETTIDEMLINGELDAYVNVNRPAPELLAEGSGIRRLFDDPRSEGIRYFRQTGIYPTNHCIIVKHEIAESYPWVPLSIFRAFQASNVRSLVSHEVIDPYVETGMLNPEIREILAQNLFGYGIESESNTLETFGLYCHEQGYTEKLLPPEEVFSHAYWGP